MAGFDWGVIDMEHGPLDMGDVVHLLQAVAATRMVPVLRVPWNDTVTIKRVLDAGATTLLVPFVQNAAEAAQAVAATRYPPQGVRGMAGMSRAARFGLSKDHFTTANRAISVIVQLETETALTHLEAIAAVDGIDALFIGPADLSGSMAWWGRDHAPEGDGGDDQRRAALPRGGQAHRQHRWRDRGGGAVPRRRLRLSGHRLRHGPVHAGCAAVDHRAALARHRTCA